MDKLSPSPFCGEDADISDGGHSGERFLVRCISGRADNNLISCPAAEGIVCKTREAGVIAWNRRVPLETEPLMIDELGQLRNGLWDAILAERAAQNEKWGYPQNNTFCEWAAYLAEECGEAIKECNDFNFGKGNKEKLFTELIQTAALCLSIVEHFEIAKNIILWRGGIDFGADPLPEAELGRS